MRFTIIPCDGVVGIDGENYNGIDLSFMPQDVNAVQWLGEYGEIEIKDSRGRIIENRLFYDATPYSDVLNLWQQAREHALQKAAELKARKEAEEFELLGDMDADDLASSNAGQ